jgi:glycosyltransferase involved in cell wall biosynthesis
MILDKKEPIRLIYLSYVNEKYSRSAVHFRYLSENYNDLQTIYFKVETPIIRNIYKMIKKIKSELASTDIFVVMSPSNMISIPLRVFTKNKIVLDAGWPLLDATEIRKPTLSARAKSYVIDLLSFLCSHLVLIESAEQIKNIKRKFPIDSTKLQISYSGFNELEFLDKKNYTKQIVNQKILDINSIMDEEYVFFRGLDNEEAGIDVILDAAKELPDLKFVIASSNTERCVKLGNVTIIKEWLEWSELERLYKNAYLVLGQVGASNRINRTIAHKIFEAAYFGKVIICKRSNALEENFTMNESIYFTNKDNYLELKEAIICLYHDRELKNKLECGIKKVYTDKLSQKTISEKFVNFIC